MTEGSADQQMLLTILLRNDQSHDLDQIRRQLDGSGWWQRFPPEGVELVSWTTAMGLGQIITLRLPPSRLRDVHVELERCVWGLFPTECYATFDFEPSRARIQRGLAEEPDPTAAG